MMKKLSFLMLSMIGFIVFFGCSEEAITISFDSGGGTPIDSIDIETWLTGEFQIPEREGYTFDGWFLESDFLTEVTAKTEIDTSLILYAKWVVNQYTISFETNGGNEIPSSTHDFGASISTMSEPFQPGFQFLGWFIDIELSTPFSISTMPAHDLTLYAKWMFDGITVTFDSRGGTPVSALSGISGITMDVPLDPTREGYVFSGWMLDLDDPEYYIFEDFPDHSITLYADWGTEGLLFELIEDLQTYQVSVGTANELSSITIPHFHLGKHVTHIEDGGFADAEYMNTIVLPKTLISIGRIAFLNANSLSSITLPDRLETLGASAFRHCHSLSEIIVSADHLHFAIIDGVLFSKDLATLIRYPQAKTGSSYTVPNHVLTIDEDAFSSASQLISIDLGLGVTTIKTHAFYQISNLTSIVIPNQVTTIELYAFRDAYSLSSVTLGSGVTEISSYMFNGCVSLTEIIIPYQVTRIAYGAFYDCTNLRSIYIMRNHLDGLISGALFMFTNTPFDLSIFFVNQMTLDAYKVATYWSSYQTKMKVAS
jgi:uncharacterized repeat protein (TIGR02543 family)